MKSDEETLDERIARIKAKAEEDGYKMVHHSRNPDRWRFTTTVDDEWESGEPLDIEQSDHRFFGTPVLKSEPRGTVYPMLK